MSQQLIIYIYFRTFSYGLNRCTADMFWVVPVTKHCLYADRVHLEDFVVAPEGTSCRAKEALRGRCEAPNFVGLRTN